MKWRVWRSGGVELIWLELEMGKSNSWFDLNFWRSSWVAVACCCCQRQRVERKKERMIWSEEKWGSGSVDWVWSRWFDFFFCVDWKNRRRLEAVWGSENSEMEAFSPIQASGVCSFNQCNQIFVQQVGWKSSDRARDSHPLAVQPVQNGHSSPEDSKTNHFFLLFTKSSGGSGTTGF